MDPTLAIDSIRKTNEKVVIKFHASDQLKSTLEHEARLRNISLSAFMRIIASEYLQRSQSS